MNQNKVAVVKKVNWQDEYAKVAEQLSAMDQRNKELSAMLDSKEATVKLQAQKIENLNQMVENYQQTEQELRNSLMAAEDRANRDHDALLVEKGKNEILQGFMDGVKKNCGAQ